jgi:O-acetyl-ADP-ribose deacetylase (regulator of RNase III)
MSLRVSLVDISAAMCVAWNAYKLPPAIQIINQSIDTLNLNGTNVFVSPANSLGLMRGGVDSVYQKMFPSIETDVREAIRRIGYKSQEGDFFLPVGSALFVNISGETSVDYLKHCKNYLICCPSMLLPGSNISHSDNAYWCYKAVLSLMKKLPIKVDNLIVPGIGTGVGGLSYSESARSFVEALKDPRDVDESPEIPYLVLNTRLTLQQEDSPKNLPFKKFT